jgi:small redox-active disulfide protein 2
MFGVPPLGGCRENRLKAELRTGHPIADNFEKNTMKTKMTEDKNETVRRMVREGYAKIAQDNSAGCCGTSVSCCGSAPQDAQKLARELGYSVEELKSLPDGANMGLSCGNPAALAALRPGEVVLDLGSGGGFDVFIAGRKVGATGRAIGVDMTPEMLAKARRNAAGYREQTGLDNVEFHLGEIEHLPVADNSVDAIISNCVINLSPDKPQVWREMARALKPGGRVAVSDIALLRPLPHAVREMVEALVGCVAGAVLASDTERMAREAGLRDIVLTKKSDFLKAKADWNDPLYRKIAEHLPAGTEAADFITSLEIRARKTKSEDRSPQETMQLLILGSGCAKCARLYKATEQAAKALGLPYGLEKVTDLQRIMSFGVMTTPALVVDGKVKVSGRVPSVDEIKTMLA